MKIGIYYAYWQQEWDAADFIPYVKKVKSLGFDVLEVNAGSIADNDKDSRQRLKNAALENGIELSACIGLPPNMDIASSDAHKRKAGIARLKKISYAIKDCGIQKLSGIIYGAWPKTRMESGVSKKEAWNWSVNSMREVMKRAEDLNLIFCAEVVNRFEQFLLNTCGEGLMYVADVGSPNIKLLLDTFHMNIEEDSIAAAIKEASGYLGHLHVGENNRKPPGCGHIPWKELTDALKQIGFSGYIVMEPFLNPGGAVGEDIKVYRNVMPGADLDREAEKACRFMKNLIA